MLFVAFSQYPIKMMMMMRNMWRPTPGVQIRTLARERPCKSCYVSEIHYSFSATQMFIMSLFS